MDVSIIIVNYRTAALTAAAVESVRALTTGVSYEVIVVDNASGDDLSGLRDVRVLQLEDNVGFGRANNAAIETARGRNIFLLNPDTVLRNNAVKILSDYLDAHPECGVCGGNLFDGEGRPTTSFGHGLPGMMHELNELFLELPLRVLYGRNMWFNHRGRPLRVGYISGADMMIRASVLQETGAFDPDFFMYFEETELTARIRRKGYTVMSIPTAEITHLEGKSTGSHKAEMMERSRHIFYEKVYGSAKTRRIEYLRGVTRGLRRYISRSNNSR